MAICSSSSINKEPKRLSLSLGKCRKIVVVDEEEIENAKKPMVPKNTRKATDWAVGVFNQWIEQHNAIAENKCPVDILKDEPENLAHWLCVFVSEIRKDDGDFYTPRSITHILGDLQRFLNECRPPENHVRICDPSNPHFKQVHLVLDRLFRELHSKGISAVRWQSEIITATEECLLWEKGEMGTHSPSSLLNSVFFYNGLNFVLRGGDEHRDLKISQLQFEDNIVDPSNPENLISCVKYIEHGSKNRPGGRHQLNLENKVVVEYVCPELGERCHVHLLKLYLSKLPSCAKELDAFYWKPKKNIPSGDDEPWFTRNVVGHNTLDKMLKKMFKDCGINSERKTNHSLRATAISRLMEKNVPSRVIMEKSGHMSKDGLVPYERTSAVQQQASSRALVEVK